MSIGFLDFLLSTLIAVFGVLAGWFWRKAWLLSKGTSDTIPASEIQQAEDILGRLHDLAAGVAADVGEHNLQVEAISSQLSSENGDDTTKVVTAVSQLLAANSQMQRQLDTAQEQLDQQAQEIECQTTAARTDALTGLANRRVFDVEIETLTRQYAERGIPFAITILDIDHFKKFNDTHGHQVGDLVLQHAAKVYLASVPETDVVTRFGGEEFAVIHPETTVQEAAQRADILRHALDASRLHTEGTKLHISVSLGVAESARDEQPASLIERADRALYAAKEAGRNRTCWHDGVDSHPFQAPQRTALSDKPSARPSDRATDPQKGLLNRPRFQTILSESIAASKSGQAAPTVLLVQPDRFDDHADRHGGDTGERLLEAVATMLRAVDRKRGAVARFDSRTFALLVAGYDSAQAMTMAEQIRKLSQQCPLPAQSGPIQFTLSIAAAQATENDNAARMIERAEAAIDSAVRAGGDCSFFHDGNEPQPAETILSEATSTT